MAHVLMFHRVIPEKLINSPDAYATFGTLISLEFFTEVIGFMREVGYKFCRLSDLQHRDSEEKLAVLTFDDGYVDNIDYVVPLLRSLGITATFFVVVAPCFGRKVLPLDYYYQLVDERVSDGLLRERYIRRGGDIKEEFYWQPPEKQLRWMSMHFGSLPAGTPRVRYMSPSQLRKLHEWGFEVASHTMTHALLTAPYMDAGRLSYEVGGSKACLETLLEAPVRSFSFPSGLHDARTLEAVKKAGYEVACVITRESSYSYPIPCYERIFVEPNCLENLKSLLL